MQDNVSVVTPTLRRPQEVVALLENLARQTVLPREILLVDGAPPDEKETEERVAGLGPLLPFLCRYVRHGGGTAVQRNAGIERVHGRFVAFLDDDVRLEPDFLERALAIFAEDERREVGGVVGYRTNEHFRLESRGRWRWYRRLGLLKTFEPGRYDRASGYPVNANMQPPFEGVREVDFMTTACAVWRREVFDGGLRFDPFFRDYGVLEDAHFALRAGRRWKLLQCGAARCRELHSPTARENRGKIGYKSVVNYHYVFRDVFGPLTPAQRLRFWRFQLFELLRVSSSAVRRARLGDLREVGGRLRGMVAVATGRRH